MIKSATQYPVHSLLSHEGNTLYRVPPYQREYSWQKAHWEDLFDDLLEADGQHFLGTIICLNQTVDAIDANVLELIDGQQRMTTLTLLMAAVYSVLKENRADLDEDNLTDMANLRRQLVRKSDGRPRITPQRQGNNLDDYGATLAQAGLPVQATVKSYMSLRRVNRCYSHFKAEIKELADADGGEQVGAALRVLSAVQQAILVKIEVASSADAFVLFESLNNRGMPLTPVDLIKNHLLAESERRGVISVDEAFKRWSEMLTNLGDNYANQERFLRHYYNAFKAELPEVPNAAVATRANLIRIYETLVGGDVEQFIDRISPASSLYGRITGVTAEETQLDVTLRRLARAQGAPSYMLLMWLMSKRLELSLTEEQLILVADLLISFFVRRNLTGYPQTYTLPRLFMTMIEKATSGGSKDPVELVRDELVAVSVDDETFRKGLVGPVYDENSDVARFILAALSEDKMTKESAQDLWQRDKGHYVWTIEHILPQGANLPDAWVTVLGGQAAAAKVQGEHVHRLGNLTVTGYNSNLGNKSFEEKMNRVDSKGRPIGYKNGLPLNADLLSKRVWTAHDIEDRTQRLAEMVVSRFSLT